MNSFEKVKERINLNISDDILVKLIFDKNRFFDRQFTEELQKIQKKEKIVFNSSDRKKMRIEFYYGNAFKFLFPAKIKQAEYTDASIEKVFSDFLERLETYDEEKIISSVEQRLKNLSNGIESDINSEIWLEEFNERRKEKLYSFCSIILNQKIFEKNDFNENIICDFIRRTYDSLENYRHLAVVIEGEIFNKESKCITWKMLYKAGIYAENFVQFNGKFFPFKKEKKIEELSNFLEERDVKKYKEIATNFYKTISTGYKYEDCYVSNNQDCKILILKKIELDERPVPCPSCNTTIQRGNSYPEVFLRSYECANPSCPDRSKSGRGKRFDEFGTYRYFKLVENNEKNIISKETYQRWRRDIFDNENDYLELLISEYVFDNEKAFIYGTDKKTYRGRKIVQYAVDKLPIVNNSVDCYESLPIVRAFREINDNLKIKSGNETLVDDLEIVNDDSSLYLQRIKKNQIGTAITSPPYYNAREYSQWSNMVLYYIDMLINCKTVYSSIKRNGYYLYNIGDIVSEDNVYVDSNMSKRRLPLGFLSCMIFEISGFNLCGNIIWDKGEVQSKRNSTVNLCTGYVKCVNCYEHVLVFRKGDCSSVINRVERINPVIKINNKGENTYKHTAPYPLELVNLVKEFVDKNLYVFDPFLGSGTTLIWCKNNGFKGLGVELNKNYYELSKGKIINNCNSNETE